MNWPAKRIGLGLVVLVIAALYFTGSLDNVLYKVHLNFRRCGENGFGAVFCGSALTQYQHRISAAEQQARALTQTTTTASSTAAAVPASSSGGVTFTKLPDSTEAQANVVASHTCASSEASCVWFGQASQYDSTVRCPASFDVSHTIWTGPVQTTDTSVRQAVAFQPLPFPRVQVCVYVTDVATGTVLVN